jgi:hypothetical protein
MWEPRRGVRADNAAERAEVMEEDELGLRMSSRMGAVAFGVGVGIRDMAARLERRTMEVAQT